MIENIIGMELAYINTNHPDFVGGQEGMLQGKISVWPACKLPTWGAGKHYSALVSTKELQQ